MNSDESRNGSSLKMNTCGFDNTNLLKHLVSEHSMKLSGQITIDNIDAIKVVECIYPIFMEEQEKPTLMQWIEQYTSCFNMSEYIDCFDESDISMPKTKIIDSNMLFDQPNKVNKIINKFKNKIVFARLDKCSSKSHKSCSSAEDIINDLNSSERTKHIIKNTKLVLREYMNMNSLDELRCIIKNGKCRGITANCLKNASVELKLKIAKYVENISFIAEFNDCTVDVLINKKNAEMIFLEINPPVYVSATSGLFDLNDPQDEELLFGDLNEYIEYPKLRYIHNEIVKEM